MGRKIKTGLDYFPMDVDFFDDIKVRKLIKHKGSVSVLVYSYLLSLIYKDGYFLKWDEDLPFIIYEKIGQDESYIKDVINYLIDIEMFSKYMFEKENILTSKGIQKRYKKICDTLKRRNSIDVYNLINTEEIEINTEEIAIDTEETNEINTETEINSVESATKERKGKERKGKERKEKEIKDINKDCFVADESAIKTEDLEFRKNEFKKNLEPFLEIYGKDLLNDFFRYWTEHNPNGKKMRFEMEKVFDISKRLKTWSNNEKKFKKAGGISEREKRLEGVAQLKADAAAILNHLNVKLS